MQIYKLSVNCRNFAAKKVPVMRNNCFRYIASCVFTRDYPELSLRIQDYLKQRFEIEIIRCCADKYKVKQFEDVMAPSVCERWKAMPHYIPFEPDTTMISICHNCSAVFQESHPDVKVLSLWEFILQYDADFLYPDYGGERMTIQDCWRQYDNCAEQDAVRELLRRMNIEVVEMAENREHTRFCGTSLYRPAPPRNLKMAPKRFVEDAEGMFVPHTEEEQKQLMKEHCRQYQTEHVVAYCHYCTEGLRLAGQPNYHIAELLFPNSI